jgi:putative membrane protein
MKKRIYIALGVSILLGLQACQNSSDSRKADTLPADSLLDTVSASNNMLEEKETNFIQQAALGGMLEVEASNIALQKSANAKVKELAQMILTDHRKANEELTTIAGNKGLQLPATLNAGQAIHMDNLNTYTGDGFDRYYLDLMTTEHNKAIDLFTQGSGFKDGELKAFATKTLPTLKMHYDMVIAANKPLKDKQVGQGDDLINESGKIKK